MTIANVQCGILKLILKLEVFWGEIIQKYTRKFKYLFIFKIQWAAFLPFLSWLIKRLKH